MSQIRSVLADLVERRLWPVAVLLVVALVAIPVALGGGEDAAPVAAPAATPPAPASVGAVTAAERLTRRDGRPRNPFDQPAVPGAPSAPSTALGPSSATASPSASAAASGAAAPGPSISSPGPSSSIVTPAAPSTATRPVPAGKSPASTKGNTPAPAPAPADEGVWRVDMRMGPRDAMRPLHDVALLTPLPKASDPLVVLADIERRGTEREPVAIFLVAADVAVNGKVACGPSRAECRRLAVRAGQTAILRVAGDADAQPIRLEVRRIQRSTRSGIARVLLRSATARRAAAATAE